MPGVSKEQIAQARAVDLLAYLQTHEPSAIKPDGHGGFRHTEHGSLVFYRDYWYWNRAGKRMNALDYLVEIRGVRFVDAVETLCGIRGLPSYSLSVAAQQQSQKPRKPFNLPWAYRYATHMVSYLQRRGIHSDIISRCMREGTLFEARYKGEAVCVFAGYDEIGKARFGCVRGIGSDLKMDVPRSDKRYSFCLAAEQPGSRQLAVFEAPIDAMSHATLQKLEGWQWNGHRLSLGGTSDVALLSFLERHPEITRVALYLDNDPAGLVNARRIKQKLRADKRFKHIRVSINPPRRGKDYNQQLENTIEKMREEKQPRRQLQAAISF